MADAIKVGELEVGAKIALYEANDSVGIYTLVQKDYNAGKSILLRDDIVMAYRWQLSYDDVADVVYDSCFIDQYLNETWFPSLPSETTSCLSPLSYPVDATNPGSAAKYLSRNACIPSLNEMNGSSSSNYGSQFDYVDKTCLSPYWTRQPVENGYFGVYSHYANGNLNILIPTDSCGIRPTVGVDQESVVATFDGESNVYWLSLGVKAPETLLLNGVESNFFDVHPGRYFLLSWPEPVGEVESYRVFVRYSDGTTDNITTTARQVVVVSPSKGFQNVYFILWTTFSGSSEAVRTSVSRYIYTKETNVLVYQEDQLWYLADVNYYDGTSWKSTNGLNYYDENGVWHTPG